MLKLWNTLVMTRAKAKKKLQIQDFSSTNQEPKQYFLHCIYTGKVKRAFVAVHKSKGFQEHRGPALGKQVTIEEST